jgi:hypothetical protein
VLKNATDVQCCVSWHGIWATGGGTPAELPVAVVSEYRDDIASWNDRPWCPYGNNDRSCCRVGLLPRSFTSFAVLRLVGDADASLLVDSVGKALRSPAAVDHLIRHSQANPYRQWSEISVAPRQRSEVVLAFRCSDPAFAQQMTAVLAAMVLSGRTRGGSFENGVPMPQSSFIDGISSRQARALAAKAESEWKGLSGVFHNSLSRSDRVRVIARRKAAEDEQVEMTALAVKLEAEEAAAARESRESGYRHFELLEPPSPPMQERTGSLRFAVWGCLLGVTLSAVLERRLAVAKGRLGNAS